MKCMCWEGKKKEELKGISEFETPYFHLSDSVL